MSATSTLTAERLRTLFSYDPSTGVFVRLVAFSNAAKLGVPTGTPDNHGYLRIWIDGRSYKAHRLAWLYVHGTWPALQLDHENRQRANNRIANLREATQTQQNANTALRSDNRAGARGVHLHKASGLFAARLTAKGRLVHCSYHTTIEAARSAYATAASQHFGAFGRTV